MNQAVPFRIVPLLTRFPFPLSRIVDGDITTLDLYRAVDIDYSDQLPVRRPRGRSDGLEQLENLLEELYDPLLWQ